MLVALRMIATDLGKYLVSRTGTFAFLITLLYALCRNGLYYHWLPEHIVMVNRQPNMAVGQQKSRLLILTFPQESDDKALDTLQNQ